jgi:acetoacetate decarboxylase
VNEAEISANAFAMPYARPSYPRGPYRYTNREHLIITYRTDPAAIEQAVPEPLQFGEPIVQFDFLRMDSGSGFGQYSGAAQHIPVSLDGVEGLYTHNMFLNVHGPISGGREIWGFPQKLAQPRLEVAVDTIVGVLDYGPMRVATGTMGYKYKKLSDAEGAALFAKPGYLLKIIPHVDGTARICELVRYHRTEVVVKGAWTAPANLEIHPHALAPMSALPVLEVLSAVHVIADFTLDLGTIVYDYLA